MRTPEQLIETEEQGWKTLAEYNRALFSAYTFAVLLAVIAGLIAGAAVQVERQERNQQEVHTNVHRR